MKEIFIRLSTVKDNLAKAALGLAAFMATANDGQVNAQDTRVPGQRVQNLLKTLREKLPPPLSEAQVGDNLRKLHIADQDSAHVDSLYKTRLPEIEVDTPFGKVLVKRDFLDIPKPTNLILNQKQWLEISNLLANEFPDLKNNHSLLASKITELIQPYLDLDTDWGNNPKELYFIICKGIPASKLLKTRDYELMYGTDEMKGTVNVFQSAIGYLLNDVTKEDIKKAMGIEVLAHENANIRKFENYLKKENPNIDLDKAWKFAEKYLGIRRFTEYEKEILQSSPKYSAEGNLYRIDGEFVAKAVLNTKKIIDIKAIEDPVLREQELEKFYGKAKKYAVVISGSDPVSVAKMGSGLSRLVRADETGEIKLFLTVPNETLDYPGELQRPDQSILSFLDLIDCVRKPLDHLVIFGHGSRTGIKIALDRAEHSDKNPNFFELSDSDIMLALKQYLSAQCPITLQSCSTARPLSKAEYKEAQQRLKPHLDNIKQAQKSIEDKKKYIADLEKSIKELDSITNRDYVESNTRRYLEMIKNYRLDIQREERFIESNKQYLDEIKKSMYDVFAYILAAATERPVRASSVTTPNLPLTLRGAALPNTLLIKPK